MQQVIVVTVKTRIGGVETKAFGSVASTQKFVGDTLAAEFVRCSVDGPEYVRTTWETKTGRLFYCRVYDDGMEIEAEWQEVLP